MQSEILEKYNELSFAHRGVRWNATQVMIGLVGDIGDLSKIKYNIDLATAFMKTMDELEERVKKELGSRLEQ